MLRHSSIRIVLSFTRLKWNWSWSDALTWEKGLRWLLALQIFYQHLVLASSFGELHLRVADSIYLWLSSIYSSYSSVWANAWSLTATTYQWEQDWWGPWLTSKRYWPSPECTSFQGQSHSLCMLGGSKCSAERRFRSWSLCCWFLVAHMAVTILDKWLKEGCSSLWPGPAANCDKEKQQSQRQRPIFSSQRKV